MAAKNWALTQLGKGTSLELIIGDHSYSVAQFTSTWAINEIPVAQCMLALGRDTRTLKKAQAHATALSLRQMQKARVIFRPRGEYDPDGTPWPGGDTVIFDGYFMGLGYNKVNGKIHLIANLKHWLIDLACSSTLTNNSHPLNPAHLTARAVMQDLDTKGVSDIHYVSQLPGIQLIRQDILDDLWGAVKKLFCGLANFPTSVGSTERDGNCGGTGNAVKNDRARRALARMEGPAKGDTFDCSLDYVYGVPLTLDLLNVNDAEDAIAKAICEAAVESYANTTFWDKLVGEYCPAFGLAVVPAVDYALVIADTPSFRGGVWQALEPTEYDAQQMQMDLERPLRAVGVAVQFGSQMGVPEASNDLPVDTPAVGGCFAVDLAEPDDGVIQYVTAPRWLQCMVTHELYAAGTTGLKDDVANRADTTPAAAGGPVPPGTGNFVKDVNRLLNQYAQSVYVANMMRGRHGSVGGKLRFDIAPGSLLHLRGSAEKFLAGEDDLAADMVGCVSRMTVSINAEGLIAGTTFALSHLRTAAENAEDRTSVARHPLFTDSIHGGGGHGSPLVAGHEDLSGAGDVDDFDDDDDDS